RSRTDFERVHQSDLYVADRTLVVKAVDNGTAETRLGLSINRRVGCAVIRNRWKRLIREVFRLQRARLPLGLDLVVRPRRGARCDYQKVATSLPKLVAQLNRRLDRGE
ncbi:MAG: ribonuclease P protein component, partial [Planctomycetota bacterium]|nr:ribonuclease P protein component [Planctomycetota bacterium]